MGKIIKTLIILIFFSSCYRYKNDLSKITGVNNIEFECIDRQTDNWLLDIEVYRLSDKTANYFVNKESISNDSAKYKWKTFTTDSIPPEIKSIVFAGFGKKFRKHLSSVESLYYDNSLYILNYNDLHTNLELFIFDKKTKLLYLLYYTL